MAKVKARVLTDCTFGKCNTVVSVEDSEAKANPTLLDTTAAAVAAGEESAEHQAAVAASKASKK